MKKRELVVALLALSATVLTAQTETKSLVDFFLPLEPVAPLVSSGVWGSSNALPRDTANGLEDATLQNWCYWDGGVVKGDDGKYHMFASRWPQSCSHAEGWTANSYGTHAVSDNINGPYVDQGLIWPDWKVEDEEDAYNGMGHNVTCFKMHDGRYGVVTSEVTPGNVFVADSPDDPFEYLGEIEVDYNGFPSGLAHYTYDPYHMANVMILPREDGTYMIIARSMATMISEDGVCGPYKIMCGSVYGNNLDIPQTSENEDPTVWYSGGMYHIVYNHWATSTSYHFSSKDGINNWIYRGIAFKKNDPNIFVYSDGTENEWSTIERPTAVMGDDGHVSHFLFSVIDVGKGSDAANDNHGSKIVIVPFDGEAFDAYMEEISADDPEERIIPDYEVNDEDDDNLLNSHIFSFEKTGETDGLGWYFQYSDQYSITNDKAYDGNSSLKFTNSKTTLSGDIQIQGSYNNAMFAQPNIPDGYYTLSAMVWVEEEAPTTIYVPFSGSSPHRVASLDISEIAKGEWVEVSTYVDITSFNESNDRKINIQVKNSETGTYYIDNIRLIERDPAYDNLPDYATNDIYDINIFNSHVFSFEKVEDEVAGGWYFQHADQYTATTDKAYDGDYSLKYSNTATDLSGDIQIQGYYGTVAFAKPTVPEGDYILSAMFWAEEESPTHIYMPFVGSSPNVSVDFDISEIAKGEWVEVSTPVTMTDFTDDSRRVHVQVKNSETGTCYIDQIRLIDSKYAADKTITTTHSSMVKGGKSAITVSGAKGASIAVATLQGTTIYASQATSDNLEIAIPTAGIYLVVVDGRAQKVVVE